MKQILIHQITIQTKPLSHTVISYNLHSSQTAHIAITADVSFKTAQAADFIREYKNIEFLWKQRPGVGGMKALPLTQFNEVVQIDHQKISMTATGYNQVLVMIDHFTKYAEAAPCMTSSAEETCDHLINLGIARHGCPITFQSDNGKAFVGDLTKELMKRSQVKQAHSTTYLPQTNAWLIGRIAR